MNHVIPAKERSDADPESDSSIHFAGAAATKNQIQGRNEVTPGMTNIFS
jgi:hypothetical protein